MGVIAKKRNGVWWVFINHKGQRKAKRVGSKDAAKELKGKIEARLSAGDLGILEKPGLTFAEAANRWLEGYVKTELNPRSYELYSGMTERFLLPQLGPIPVKSLTRPRLRELVSGLRAKNLSRTYVHSIMATLSGILRYAVDEENLDHNPATRLIRRRNQSSEGETKERVKYWTQEQLSRLLARTKQDYPEWHDLFATMAWAGFRVGEALGLQWDDIDQEEGVIYLRRKIYGRRQGLPKGNKGRRIEMAEQLARLLADRKSRMEAEAALNGRTLSPWVFSNAKDHPPCYESTRKVLIHVLDLERIPRYERVMTHAFRHSWATWILQNAPTPGAILYVSRQLGHSSVKITLDVYAHVIPEENRHLSDMIANATSRNLTATTTPNPLEIHPVG